MLTMLTMQAMQSMKIMMSNRSERPRLPAVQVRLSRESPLSWLERENLRLTQENQRLRQQCADLAASSELWIALYEAALRRVGAREQ